MRTAYVLVASCLHLACAGATPRPPAAAAESAARVRAAPPEAQHSATSGAQPPTENGVAEADAIVRDSLAVPARDERFSVDRQVSELERAIGLYRQFLERAGDDPRFADAVKRSRERVADAEQTIVFLRQQSDEQNGGRR